MSTTPHSEPQFSRGADDLRWAREVLRIPESVSPEETRGLLLARLEEVEFVPPDPWEQAILLLADEPAEALWRRGEGQEPLRPREALLQAEVDRLAEEFFGMPPSQRRRCWLDLMRQAEFSPVLVSQLQGLAAGLDAVPPSFHTLRKPTPTTELAEQVCRAFVLPPWERAAWHEEISRQAELQPKAWQNAARHLRRAYPQLVPLAPKTIGRLSDLVRAQKAVAKRERQRAAVPRAPNGSQFPWWIVALVVLALGRLASFNTNAPNPPSNMPPRFTSPAEPSSKVPLTVLPPFEPGDPAAKSAKKISSEALNRLMNLPDDIEIYEGPDGGITLRKRWSPQEPVPVDKPSEPQGLPLP